MSTHPDDPRRIPHPSTLPRLRSVPDEPLHHVGATDERIGRLLPAGLVTGSIGGGLLFAALAVPSLTAAVVLGVTGGLLLLTATTILAVWEAVRKEPGATSVDVEDWQRDR